MANQSRPNSNFQLNERENEYNYYIIIMTNTLFEEGSLGLTVINLLCIH